MTFWYKGTSGSMNVERATNLGGPWTAVTSPFAGSGSWEQKSVDLSAYSNIYIRFTRVPSAGNHYIDDLLVTLGGGAPPSSGNTVKINFQPSGADPPTGDWMRDWGSGNNGLSHVPPYSFSW